MKTIYFLIIVVVSSFGWVIGRIGRVDTARLVVGSSNKQDCQILSGDDVVQKIVLSLLTARKGMRMLA